MCFLVWYVGNPKPSEISYLIVFSCLSTQGQTLKSLANLSDSLVTCHPKSFFFIAVCNDDKVTSMLSLMPVLGLNAILVANNNSVYIKVF